MGPVDRMTVIRRYTAQEVAEFVNAHDLSGLNDGEIVEALNDYRDHLEATGHTFGTADDRGAVEALRDLLAAYDRVYPKGGRRLPGPGMYVATEKARHYLGGR
jgi:hypothetical protein